MQKTIVMTLKMVLEREPGDYPDVTADQVVASITDQFRDSILVTTDQLVPYRVTFIKND